MHKNILFKAVYGLAVEGAGERHQKIAQSSTEYVLLIDSVACNRKDRWIRQNVVLALDLRRKSGVNDQLLRGKVDSPRRQELVQRRTESGGSAVWTSHLGFNERVRVE